MNMYICIGLQSAEHPTIAVEQSLHFRHLALNSFDCNTIHIKGLYNYITTSVIINHKIHNVPTVRSLLYLEKRASLQVFFYHISSLSFLFYKNLH